MCNFLKKKSVHCKWTLSQQYEIFWCLKNPGEGVLTLTWYMCICACLLGRFCTKFGIAIVGFSSERNEPKLTKWVYFEQIIVIRKGILMGNWAKNWYRESLIFEVWQAHPRTILVKVTPPPPPPPRKRTVFPGIKNSFSMEFGVCEYLEETCFQGGKYNILG